MEDLIYAFSDLLITLSKMGFTLIAVLFLVAYARAVRTHSADADVIDVPCTELPHQALPAPDSQEVVAMVKHVRWG